MTNQNILVVGLALALGGASASASTLIYEPFDYTTGATIVPGSTSTNSGNGLVDNYGPNAPTTWQEAGVYTTATTAHQVSSTGLTAPAGLTASTGRAAIMEGGAASRGDSTEMARMNLPGGPYTTNAVLYYSLLLNVTDLSGLTTANSNANANNDLIIGFNNSNGASSGRPSVWAGELTIRLGSVANTYNLGIRASTTTAGTTYWSGDLSPNNTNFIVVRWTEANTAGAAGTSELWVNPNSANFGAAVAPGADGSTLGTFSTTGTNDHTNSLIIGAGIAGGATPNETTIDEIRAGTTWADVTPVPEPVGLGIAAVGAFGILARRHRNA